MSTKSVMFVFIMGLLVTMFGVGGVENSITNLELLSAVTVSAVGLLMMWVATLGMKTAEYYDE